MPELEPTIFRIAVPPDPVVIRLQTPATPEIMMITSPGPQGTSGPGGSSVDHVQSSPSAEWIINHNLGRKPLVQTFSVGGLEVDGSVLHVSLNQTRVSFVTPIAGTARLV